VIKWSARPGKVKELEISFGIVRDSIRTGGMERKMYGSWKIELVTI